MTIAVIGMVVSGVFAGVSVGSLLWAMRISRRSNETNADTMAMLAEYRSIAARVDRLRQIVRDRRDDVPV